MGFFLIKPINTSPTIIVARTIPMELCTPIHAIQNPANAGPSTMASCHVELLQVAALGYTFFGTIKATNENIVGPINALINPPRKTKI